MTDPPSDPLLNAVYAGIKRGIQICLENECFGAALVLIYAGIDAMANLGRPEEQEEVGASDFMTWCELYINLEGETEVTGEEWYSARCAVLHTYGSTSRLTLSCSKTQPSVNR